MFKLTKLVLIVTPVITMTNANAQTEPEMIAVPAACIETGTLLMNQQANPLREVCVDSFSIGRYEVTFREYDQFTDATGQAARHDLGFGRGNRPVIDVNWFDAAAYANWLSEQTGKIYRLPTDAEWEYAAKANAGIGFGYSWGNEPTKNKANCRNCGSQWDAQKTAPIGSFDSNSLGLNDMHGNVWEWTSDCYYGNASKDIEGKHCKVGVVRGGSWDVDVSNLAFWIRAPQISTETAQDIGFRLVLEP